ncbi:hypothetical protein WN51_04639 [Melipona quadrifasciata]|uniref:Uncharacterized protein n=1 Tax=Melipona quadrifasciata TaxID=166423 RepID=A0A0N0BDY7_9HYME|nr:hypothetical protein WN51_04639 [Melipona quadrifasciata]
MFNSGVHLELDTGVNANVTVREFIIDWQRHGTTNDSASLGSWNSMTWEAATLGNCGSPISPSRIDFTELIRNILLVRTNDSIKVELGRILSSRLKKNVARLESTTSTVELGFSVILRFCGLVFIEQQNVDFFPLSLTTLLAGNFGQQQDESCQGLYDTVALIDDLQHLVEIMVSIKNFMEYKFESLASTSQTDD